MTMLSQFCSIRGAIGKIISIMLLVCTFFGCVKGVNSEYSDQNMSYSIIHNQFEDINEENDTHTVIEYPSIVGLKDKNREKVVNEIIKNAAINDYFNHGNTKGTKWLIQYRVSLLTENYLSVVFEGYSDKKGAAHPTRRLYGATVNLHTGEKMLIYDLFQYTLYQNYDRRVFRYKGGQRSDDPNTITYIIEHTPDESISKMFKDEVDTSHNAFGCFYLTDDELILFIPTSHAMGEQLPFHAKYADLSGLLNTESPFWHELLK